MIINSKELSKVRNEHKGETIGLRFGCYDLLHAGHQRGIDFAAAMVDILVIGVMPDLYVAREKGLDRPINTEAVRVSAIDEAAGVDYSFVAPFGRLALAGAFLRLRPDIYVEDEGHGTDFMRTQFLRTVGVKYVMDDERYKQPVTTTAMINSLGLDEARARAGLDFVLSESEMAEA